MSQARDNGTQDIQFLRRNITYLDDGKTLDIGTLPAYSQIIKPISGVSVNVAFNGGATNTLDVGPSTDAGTNLWGTVLSLASIAFVPLDEAVSMTVTVDTLVQVAVVSTTAASAGAGTVVIAYICNR